MLYKYPQAEFPYADLVAVNGARGKGDPEYELLDTGVFDESRYFDVDVEYAKAAPEDILMQVTVHNRGPDDAELHVLPTLWFRHTWSWAGGAERPSLRAVDACAARSVIRAEHAELGSSAGCTPTGRCRSWSRRTRPTTSGCSGRRTRRRTSRTASTGPWSTATTDAVNPAGDRDQGRPALQRRWSRPGAAPRCGCG